MDFNWPPEVHMWRLSPWWCYWEVVGISRGSRSWIMPLRVYWNSYFSCFLATLVPTHILPRCSALTAGPRRQGQVNMDWNCDTVIRISHPHSVLFTWGTLFQWQKVDWHVLLTLTQPGEPWELRTLGLSQLPCLGLRSCQIASIWMLVNTQGPANFKERFWGSFLIWRKRQRNRGDSNEVNYAS